MNHPREEELEFQFRTPAAWSAACAAALPDEAKKAFEEAGGGWADPAEFWLAWRDGASRIAARAASAKRAQARRGGKRGPASFAGFATPADDSDGWGDGWGVDPDRDTRAADSAALGGDPLALLIALEAAAADPRFARALGELPVPRAATLEIARRLRVCPRRAQQIVAKALALAEHEHEQQLGLWG